jgi:hypothetical protein
MVAKVSQGDTKLVDLPQEICDRLFKQSQLMSLDEIFTTFNILIATQEMTKRLDSQRIPLEISLVRLAHNKLENRGLAIDKPKSNACLPARQGLASNSHSHNQGHNNQQNSSSVPAEPKAPSLPFEKKEQPMQAQEEAVKNIPKQIVSISLENVKDVWDNIVNNLSKIKMSVSTYLSEGVPTKVQGDLITVAFPKSCSLHKESLDRKENKTIVEKAASELCNADLRINFILVADMKHNTDVRNNPFVKSALEMFGGRVVKED